MSATSSRFKGSTEANGKPPRPVAYFEYQDAAGKTTYRAVRMEPGYDGRDKSFKLQRPDDKGGWIDGKGDAPWVLFRLPELQTAHKSQSVFVVEGEGKVEALRLLGLAATCNPTGAGKWRQEYAAQIGHRGQHA
jgi:hypothetical protein